MNSYNNQNKERVASVLVYILNPVNQVPQYLKNRIFNEMLWSATADYNSIDSHKYKLPIWSQGAINHYPEWLNNGRKGLIHEHIYPKILLRGSLHQLANAGNANYDSILNLLIKYSHAAVIHKNELPTLNNNGFAQNLPLGFQGHADDHYLQVLFSRYTASDIDLRFVNFNGIQIEPTDSWYVQNAGVNEKFINQALNFAGWAGVD